MLNKSRWWVSGILAILVSFETFAAGPAVPPCLGNGHELPIDNEAVLTLKRTAPLGKTFRAHVAGKVSRVLSVRIDEKTGEGFREELIRYFYIGREQTAAMPIGGRLYLGVNEDVVKDNDGQFVVSIYGRPEVPNPVD